MKAEDGQLAEETRMAGEMRRMEESRMTEEVRNIERMNKPDRTDITDRTDSAGRTDSIRKTDRTGRTDSTKAVVFDWAGTTVDYGCFAPVGAFQKVFEHMGITPTMEEVREPMGMLKRDHLRTMLEMPRIKALWIEKCGLPFQEKDLDYMYDYYETALLESLKNYAYPKPGVIGMIDELRKRNIRIGSTTGYTSEMMKIVSREAEKNGYKPDCFVSPDMVSGIGRPYPYMIFENMKILGIKSVSGVMKVGDTVSDILEGINAGVISVGVIEGSSVMGLTEQEYDALSPAEKADAQQKAKEVFLKAGADDVILNISELPELL